MSILSAIDFSKVEEEINKAFGRYTWIKRTQLIAIIHDYIAYEIYPNHIVTDCGSLIDMVIDVLVDIKIMITHQEGGTMFYKLIDIPS